MIQWLHRLREEEEGQTLVLGAVFGIILALCVLGTVNMGRAVYEKIGVQTACDNGAYSQAAVEARVLNLTAYTNRAMVVHYSSIMAMSAYLTWLHFTAVWVHGLLTVLSFIPIAGSVFSTINQVITVLLQILDYAVAIMTPIIAAANVVLYGLQEGAWAALYSGRLAQMPQEAHSGDSAQAQYQQIWSGLSNFANQTVFAQTRGNLTLFTSLGQSLSIFINSGNAQVQEARLHMLEIANSAREPWVAYGDHYNSNFVLSPLARHFIFRINALCNAQGSINARTQMGAWAPGLNLTGLLNTTGEIYSGSRAEAAMHCTIPIINVGVDATISLFSLTTLDQFLGFTSLTPQSAWQGLYVSSSSSLIARAINLFMPAAIPAASQALVAYGKANAPVKADYRAMWISPYVFFAPSTKAGPAGGISAVGPGLGNFGQPDVILGLARQRADFNSNQNVFGGKVNGIITGGGGQVDYTYNGNDWPSVPGLPAGLQLQQGFNAVCAAQVYYHRPGDWKEMPNFFNPLWAARLMPVTESNSGAALGLNNVPLIKNLLLH